MRADSRFKGQSKDFWAHVRSIGEANGYTHRRKKKLDPAGDVKTLTAKDIVKAFRKLELSPDHLVAQGQLSPLGEHICAYFAYRADALNRIVRPNLMNVDEARALWNETNARLRPTLKPPMNKQKGEKKAVAFFTATINALLEGAVGPKGFNPNPGQLTTFTADGKPLRTLARRVDGALPGIVNPSAIWEIKEYYYTTSFGSRVADGVYETLLDGMELEEMRESMHRDVQHMLAVDARYTWWECGRSYLCRIVDMLHMGYVDEVLFGREIVNRVPALAAEWRQLALRIAPAEPIRVGEVSTEPVGDDSSTDEDPSVG